MSIEVTCLQCNESHHVNERLAGRRVRCPSCDTVVHVPESAPQTAGSDAQGQEIEDPDAVESDTAIASVVDESESPVIVEATPIEPTDSAAAVAVPAVTTAVSNPLPDDDEDDDEGDVLVRSNLPEEEMDMTPMVDVTFLLLIFFMVTAAFSLQKSIKMPRQQTEAPSINSNPEETEELESVEVQVDEFGSYLVLASDWERETPGKQNLITALRDAIGGRKDGVKLIVKVHELAKLKALVDAMDAGTISGYSELEVTQVEEFN